MNPTTYDYNTGKALAPGQAQSKYNTATGQRIGDTSFVPTTPVTTTISGPEIGNTQPYRLAPTVTPTAVASVMGTIEATNQQAQSNIEPLVDTKAIAEDKKTNQTLRDRITNFITQRSGQTALTDAAYSQNVDPAKQELTDITNQINAKQLAYRRQIEELQKNNTGALESGVNVQVGNIQRQAASELADLSVIQQAKSNNYANAKEIADRKVALELEKDKNDFDALQFFYTENKADLSKKEDQQFQLLISERKRLLDQQETEKKAVNDIALEALKNGADQVTAQKILSSKDQASALAVGGRFVGLLDRQTQLLQQENLRQNIAESKFNMAQKLYETHAADVIPGAKPIGKPDYQSAAYANRAVSANEIISNLGSQFISAASYIGQSTPNVIKSADRQSFEQAKKSFVTAVLRKESGASISPSEFNDADKVYFPQPGDAPEILVQKEQSRIDAANGLIGSAGKAYNGVYIAPKSTGLQLKPLPKGSTGTLSSGITYTIN